MAIVKMKKVSLVVLDSTRKESLKLLKKVGVVHLEAVEGKGSVLAGYKESLNDTFKAISILDEIKVSKKQKIAPVSLEKSEAAAKAKEIIALSDRKKSLMDQIAQNTQELDRLSAWGSVDPAELAALAEKGIFTYMYEIPMDKYANIGDDVKTLLVNSKNKIARFLLTSDVEVTERPEGIPPEAYAVPLPVKSTSDIDNDIRKAKAEITSIDQELTLNKKYRVAIEKYNVALNSDIEFETFYTGMGREQEEEVQNEQTSLAWLTGYVPVDSMAKFTAACKENGWAYAADDPADDDPVPTKLKNNKFVSLIYPLTDFLGTVPGYHEYDISGWFLLFFTIFFGMIFGDGGYGLLITFMGLVLGIKSIASKKGGAMAGLVILLGLATVAWGTVTCTWFGLGPEMLPDWLKNLSVPQISNAYADKLWTIPWKPESGLYLTNAQNLQIFCFSLALIQLSVAHLKGIFAHIKSLRCLGELGALLQLIGMFWIVLSMVVSSEVFTFGEVIYGVPVGTIAMALIGVGFVLSFIFSNYEGSIGKSVLESCKNIISVLLGVVNVFSDIVSYIRLWAVGLAGAAISGTVNNMAGPLLGHAILFIAFVALVLFGHGLNMILNLLSVIVHGVRLNTLEFSNHLGMSWSGFKYSPFKEED